MISNFETITMLGGEDTAETKPKIEGGDEVLSIKVKDQQGGEVCMAFEALLQLVVETSMFSVGCVQS